jgi:recombinational DNA repair ATPase RecF
MSSTTTSKKEILDFLWEWSETRGEWGKLLIQKLVASEADLETDDRQIIFDYFLQSIGLVKGLTSVKIPKPTYALTNKTIRITKLSNVNGVNRLSTNECIDFTENLTVVFGENGTGKTGYSRILKKLGYSHDTDNTILGDIFSEEQEKSATIEFLVDSDERTFEWDGTNYDEELANISVFNDNCVQISLQDRDLIVSPIGFHFFTLVANELRKLEEILEAKIASYQISLPWLNELQHGSDVHLIVSNPEAIRDEELENLKNFDDENLKELAVAENELSGLNRSLLENDITNSRLQIRELGGILSSIEAAEQNLNWKSWVSIDEIETAIITLESKKLVGLSEIAHENGIEFYETDEFQTFLRAADAYVKRIAKPTYPDANDKCLYCLQPLSDNAIELLSSYRKLLNDQTERTLTEYRRKKAVAIESIKAVDSSLSLRQPAFGLDADSNAIQPSELVEYNREISKFKEQVLVNKPNESKSELDYEKYKQFISNKIEGLTKILNERTTSLGDLTAIELKLRNKIANLKGRKIVKERIAEVIKVRENHQIVRLLNDSRSQFNTRSISVKNSEASQHIIQDSFNEFFKNELKMFRKAYLNIDLGFATEKGKSKVSQRINSHLLSKILSDGEQKAIAIAEFLTELEFDQVKALVIFDDPVTSLDHNIIDDVARRFIRLSGERQTIVFTHSVLLFNSFLYFSQQPSFSRFKFRFYNSRSEFGQTGIITQAEEEINKVTTYISKLNSLFNNKPKDIKEVDLAEDGYGFLRSAIELCVEFEILKGTVKRYQKNIALTSFAKVDGEALNIHKDKLIEIFERCCGFIKGHSNPTEVYNDPKLDELKIDFDEFIRIRNTFK